MTLSPSSGFIVPEIWVAAVMARINGQLTYQNFATVFNELQGQPGDTINLVEFARLSELTSDQSETTALTPEQLTSSADQQILIREAAKAVEVTKRAQLTAFGDPISHAQNEAARVIAKRVDTVLRDAALASATLEDGTAGVIDNAAVTTALQAYGDRIVSGETVSLVIHSKQWRDMKSDAKFERVENATEPGLAGILDGIIPVYVSDLTTIIEDGGGAGVDHYRGMLFAGKPLAYAHKREVETDQQKDVLARTTTVVSSLHYAGGVMTPADIVELRTQ